MRTTRIGSTGVEVTALGFGSAPIGNLYAPVDENTAAAAVPEAWERGVRYFDTAPHYGLGLAERRLGRALAPYPRGEYILSTKVGRLLVANENPRGSDLDNGFAVPDDLRRELDYSASGARRSIEDSLKRLRLNRLDIALVHDPDRQLHQAIHETLPALARLRDEGLIRAIGVGMNYWQPLTRVVHETDVDVVMVAGRWTLLDRSARPLMALCESQGVSVLAAAPFNSGILAQIWPSDDAVFDYEPASAAVLRRARDLATACRQTDTTLPHAALQFPLRHPAVAAVVAGLGHPEHVRSAVDWITRPLPSAAWRVLERDAPLPAGRFSDPTRCPGPADGGHPWA